MRLTHSIYSIYLIHFRRALLGNGEWERGMGMGTGTGNGILISPGGTTENRQVWSAIARNACLKIYIKLRRRYIYCGHIRCVRTNFIIVAANALGIEAASFWSVSGKRYSGKPDGVAGTPKSISYVVM